MDTTITEEADTATMTTEAEEGMDMTIMEEEDTVEADMGDMEEEEGKMKHRKE